MVGESAYFVYPSCHAANDISLPLGLNPELAAFSLLLFNDPGIAMAHESNDVAAICSQFEEACTDFQA